MFKKRYERNKAIRNQGRERGQEKEKEEEKR